MPNSRVSRKHVYEYYKKAGKGESFFYRQTTVLHLEEVIRNPLPESLAMFWKSVEQKWPNLDELTY